MQFDSTIKHFCVLLTALCFLFAVPGSSARPVYPKDEAKKDPSLVAFRRQLISAVDRKDGKYISSILHAKVLAGLGGGVGKADFEREWDLADKNSPFWTKFKFAITHGGYFEEKSMETKFTAPYAIFFFPDEDGTDTETERAVVMQTGVPLRSMPNDTAPAVTTLNYDLVKIADAGNKDKWVGIQTADGKKGYLPGALLIRQTSPYAEFEKRNGKWSLVWFGTASP